MTQFDDLREGYEGQGINIAIIDTGIDWTHPMFGGDPTPPRLGVAPRRRRGQYATRKLFTICRSRTSRLMMASVTERTSRRPPLAIWR